MTIKPPFDYQNTILTIQPIRVMMGLSRFLSKFNSTSGIFYLSPTLANQILQSIEALVASLVFATLINNYPLIVEQCETVTSCNTREPASASFDSRQNLGVNYAKR